MRIAAVCSALCVVAGFLLFDDALGGEPLARQLTNDPAQDGFPTWAPDGTLIAFSRYAGDAAPEKTGLWVMAPDGSNPRQLTTVIAEHPDWSPDGRYIVFDGDYGNTIQLVSASGGTPIRVAPDSLVIDKGGQSKWSPDGSRLVFKAQGRLWMIDVATGNLDSIYDAGGMLVLPLCWSPDGGDIYIYLRERETRAAWIGTIPATGGEIRRLTPEENAAYRYADVSPDGTLLAVVLCEGRNCDLWAMSSSGGPRVQITFDPDYDDGPAWSPDGRTIAFVSTRSGHFDVWAIDVDPSQLSGAPADPAE